MKEIRYNVSQYESRTGQGKVIANEEKGRRGPEKDAHLKTPSLMCRLSPRFQPKENSQKRPLFLSAPPLWFDHVVLQGTPPSPLTDNVVSVPSLSRLIYTGKIYLLGIC